MYNVGFWGSVEMRNTHDVPIHYKWVPNRGFKSDEFFALQSSGKFLILHALIQAL